MKILIVVDMQNDFVTGSLGTEEAKKIVLNVVKKVKEYKKNNDKIFFTMDTHGENYLQTDEGKRLPVPHCIKGTYGWNIIPELKAFIEKDNANIFIKSIFGSYSLVKDIDELYDDCYLKNEPLEVEIIGVCTDICVVSNSIMIKNYVTSYGNPSFSLSVDASCCAGTTPENHKAALTTMKMCQIEIIGDDNG